MPFGRANFSATPKKKQCVRVNNLEVCYIGKCIDIPSKKISGPADVVNAVNAINICERHQEEVHVIYMSAKNCILATRMVARGTITDAMVDPSIVFAPALTIGSPIIIVFHNHPSGNPVPSTEDRMFTNRLLGAGKILGIHMIDHIILGSDGEFFSFADKGLL